MSDIVQKKKREDSFKNYIQEILRNREVDCDETWWTDEAAQAELKKLAEAEENYITDSSKMNIDGTETLIFSVYQKQDDSFAKTVENRISALSSISGSKAPDIQLVFFVEDMRSRIFLEKTFPRNIICVLIRRHIKQEVKLSGLNRFDMMQEPPVCGKVNLEKGSEPPCDESVRTIRGLVCTANLFQIVELYNMFGDQLFKYNVRIGMKETLSVNSAIRKTLETEPEQFWFKNNGITILVENPDFKINQAEELTLDQIEAGGELRFSVVNGAQTINTAAQYFYGLDYQLGNSSASEKEEVQNKLDRSKKARILLRVIHIPATDNIQQASALAKEISVALNRQKPIKIEDMAFTAPFVEKLVNYLAKRSVSEGDNFQVVRRGEKTDKNRQMDLVEFARARLACAGYPGDARSQSANKLLEFQTEKNESFFANKIIFVEDWMAADQSNQDDIFKRDYKAVWYAHRIALKYEKIMRNLSDNELNRQNIIKNGKWYFTAFLIQMINGYKQQDQRSTNGKLADDKLPDFSDFTCDLNNVLKAMEEVIACFAAIVAAYIDAYGENRKYGELDSNLFKKNDLYKDIMRKLTGEEMHAMQNGSGQLFLQQCQSFAKLLSLKLFPQVPPADSVAVPGVRYASPEKYVILGQNTFSVASDADALEMVVSHILSHYQPWGNWLEETRGWLNNDSEAAWRRQGYFRSAPRKIYVNGIYYWLGTSSNTQTKCRQMEQLCALAGVSKGSISWYKNSQEEPIFVW